ncbi:DUF1330 domain-containing protein [Psychromarinibacter sp. C21-152]|uniref:DUF1330 domain-containing protein n=1 Tax=Psychromarinibacter sediminicola TaxID=3033385 RepID=A0AAE3NRL8_9RHOB|nr:DUF1330 domain-containing protein [Psychromarinibacter sediminicola]MDF0600374.1 DUF1330 domain-containing protein [Psychromarinibacter sediminicola]
MPTLAPSDTAARALFAREQAGPVVMVNLLRFREMADYSAAPDRAPPAPVSGAAAYARYVAETLPLLEASGGAVIFEGRAERWFIGPEEERWDHVLIVRQASLSAFRAFADAPAAQAALVHRTAALADSRLLPAYPGPAA